MKKMSKTLTLILSVLTLLCVWTVSANAAALVPNMPTALEAESYGADEVDLYWNDALLADGYRVFIRENNKWKVVADTEDTEFTVEGLVASTKYTFAVRSYRVVSGGYTWSTKYSTVSACTDELDDEDWSILYATAGTTSIELKWTKVYGVSGYRIFRYENKKWIKVKDVNASTLNYTVTGLKGLTQYTYAVRPYAKTGLYGVKWAALSNTAKATTKNPKQVQLKGTSNSNSVTLSWDKVEGATGYRVYIRQNGAWKALKTLGGTSYTVSSLKSDTYYYFCAKAYQKVNGQVTWFPLSTSFKYATEPDSANLKAYRVEKYEKLLSGNYLMEITNEFDDYYGVQGKIIAVRNGYQFFKYTDDYSSFQMSFIYNARTDKYYYVFDSYKLYYSESASADGDYDYDDEDYYFGDTDFVLLENRGKISVSVVDFEGQKVICESYKDTDDCLYKYYFKEDTLIAYDIDYSEYFGEEPDDTNVDRYYVTKFTTSVPSSYFAIPQGYKLITEDELLEIGMP